LISIIINHFIVTLRVKCSVAYHFLSLSHDNDDVKYMYFIVLYLYYMKCKKENIDVLISTNVINGKLSQKLSY